MIPNGRLRKPTGVPVKVDPDDVPGLKRGSIERVRLLSGQRQKAEHPHIVQACNDFLRLGPGRTYAALIRSYRAQTEAGLAKGYRIAVPTLNATVMRGWSKRFGWIERAEAYDHALEARRTHESEQIMATGYATIHERVHLLDRLTRAVVDELDTRGLYEKEAVTTGTEENARTRILRKFKRSEIRELRGLMDDLAKETGGRVRETNHNHKGLAGLLSGATGWEDAEYTDVTPGQIGEGVPNDPNDPQPE